MEQGAMVRALLEPVKTHKFTAPNRFVRSATYLASADKHGAVGAAEARRIAELACGGVGTIISGFAYISPEGKSAPKQWGIDDDRRIDDVRLLSRSAHQHGAKFIVQLVHAGAQHQIQDELASLSRSVCPHLGIGAVTGGLTDEEFAKIYSDFADAARRAKEGGADGVEIHGAHGFLLTQFLSPLLNKRTDAYGGLVENRARIFSEVFAAVRTAVGEDFPIWCKISIAEGVPAGYPAADGLYTARTLLGLGIDGIEISSGTFYSSGGDAPSMVGVSAGESEAPFKAYAAELKRFSSKDQLITLTGGLRSLSVMAGLVNDNICDLLGLSRPLIAEPDLINRWFEEDARPAACISCNACRRTSDDGLVGCPVLRDRNEGNWSPL